MPTKRSMGLTVIGCFRAMHRKRTAKKQQCLPYRRKSRSRKRQSQHFTRKSRLMKSTTSVSRTMISAWAARKRNTAATLPQSVSCIRWRMKTVSQHRKNSRSFRSTPVGVGFRMPLMKIKIAGRRNTGSFPSFLPLPSMPPPENPL